MKIEYTKKIAKFSKNNIYRYNLIREWKEDHLKEKRTICFIGLNPSVGNSIDDDPTIRRMVNFAKAYGANGINIVNLFALVTTYPKYLKDSEHDPIGINNDEIIIKTAKKCWMTFACWGNNGEIKRRGEKIINLLKKNNITIYCFGLTSRLNPKHPLYLKSNTLPAIYENEINKQKIYEKYKKERNLANV